jgi:putative transposase
VSIFREDTSYLFVLKRMKTYCRSLAITTIAYCLLPNHYHLLVRQDGDHPAGLLPQRVFNSYSKAYNRRYDHSGTLFEGPYRSAGVGEEGYLLHLCRYIHANPAIHALVDDAAQWPWSNYLEWVGARSGTLVDRELIRSYFPDPEAYRDFVARYIGDRRLPAPVEAHLARIEG